MAKIYAPPEGFDPPEFDPSISWEEQEQRENEYIERLAAALRARTNSKDPLIGKEFSHGIADGAARYMVSSVRPLALVHLALGDAYRLPAAHERGLTLADVRQRAGSTLFRRGA